MLFSQGFGVEDSDAESPRDIHCSVESTGFPTGVKKQIEEPIKDIEISSVSLTENCYQSGRDAMPSVNPSTPLTAPRHTTSAEKPANKTTGLSTVSAKHSSSWGRSNVSFPLSGMINHNFAAIVSSADFLCLLCVGEKNTC